MTTPAHVLVIVPCLNEAANLPRLLAQFAEEPEVGRVVVADGGSVDASRQIVAEIAALHEKVVLLDNPLRIQSAGINLAVARFGHGFDDMVRVDAHCDYPPGYVGRLLAARDRSGAGAVVVPMVSRGITCFQIAAATAQNSRLGTGGSAHRHLGAAGRWVDHGHHALMPLAAFRAVGAYREDMSHNEDAELDHRLGRAGIRLWLEPDAALSYLPRASAGALWRQYWRYGRGRARTVQLHRMRIKPRQLAPLAVPVAVVAAALVSVHPVFALPLAIWLALTLAGGAVAGLHQRSGWCGLLSGVAAGIMHLAWGAGFLWQVVAGRAAEKDRTAPRLE